MFGQAATIAYLYKNLILSLAPWQSILPLKYPVFSMPLAYISVKMWGDMRMITVRYSQFYFDVILVIVEYWMMMTVPQLRHTVKIRICMICILVLYTYIERDSTTW